MTRSLRNTALALAALLALAAQTPSYARGDFAPGSSAHATAQNSGN
ncbi:MAG TPA: hypothetical protein VMI52_07235 [Acetobacteraceae bacterium]|nr:hypothetical protein [Acetobacteraceae bacterium]